MLVSRGIAELLAKAATQLLPFLAQIRHQVVHWQHTIQAAQKMGPLAGIKVLDLSKYGPSHYTSMILADPGAEVIVVEMPKNAVQTLDVVSDDVGSLYIGTIATRSALCLI